MKPFRHTSVSRRISMKKQADNTFKQSPNNYLLKE